MADASADVRIVDRVSPGIRVASDPRYERFKAGHPAGFLEAFANLYWDLADSLIEFRTSGTQASEFVFGAGHAANGLRMLETIARSSKGRTWCAVPHEEPQ